MAADPNTEALTVALAAKDETIELLKQQLEAQTRANDENHRIIGALRPNAWRYRPRRLVVTAVAVGWQLVSVLCSANTPSWSAAAASR
jgi:hypothetical protein